MPRKLRVGLPGAIACCVVKTDGRTNIIGDDGDGGKNRGSVAGGDARESWGEAPDTPGLWFDP